MFSFRKLALVGKFLIKCSAFLLKRERERERERPRNVRAGVRLSQLFLPYTYVVFFTFRFGEMSIFSFLARVFFLFFFGESCTCTEFRVDKKGPDASIAMHFPVFSLDFVWNFQVILNLVRRHGGHRAGGWLSCWDKQGP